MDTMDQLPRHNASIQLPSVDDEESDDFSIIQSIQVFKGLTLVIVRHCNDISRFIYCG